MSKLWSDASELVLRVSELKKKKLIEDIFKTNLKNLQG